MRNTHCRTWNMVRNSEKRENEKYTLQTWIMARKLKNVEKEMQTPQELEYGEKH